MRPVITFRKVGAGTRPDIGGCPWCSLRCRVPGSCMPGRGVSRARRHVMRLRRVPSCSSASYHARGRAAAASPRRCCTGRGVEGHDPELPMPWPGHAQQRDYLQDLLQGPLCGRPGIERRCRPAGT